MVVIYDKENKTLLQVAEFFFKTCLCNPSNWHLWVSRNCYFSFFSFRFFIIIIITLCMEFSVKIWQSPQRKISLYKSVIRRKVGVSTSTASRHQNWYLATIVFRSSFCCEVTRFVVGQPENVVSCSTFRQKENFTQFKLHAVKREKYNVTGIKISCIWLVV